MAELATDYLEGDLPWHRRLSAWLHLRACQACQAYFSQMRRTIGLLRGLPAQPPAESTVEDLLSKAGKAPML